MLSHSFDIRHSCFFIFDSAFIQRAQDGLFFRRDVPPDEHQFRSICLKWLEFPAAGHEIEKLRAIGEADEALGANDAAWQATYKVFETIARESFIGSKSERFQFMLMHVVQTCDFSLASNSKQQLRINPATLRANNCRGWIDLPQLGFKWLDLPQMAPVPSGPPRN